jgi:hypothetical protein
MTELYPLFFGNLSDSIASVRQGAAVALTNVVKAYGIKESYLIKSIPLLLICLLWSQEEAI